MKNGYDYTEYGSCQKTTALLLCIFLGCFGAHNFYTKHYVKGIIYFLTFGVFTIGWLVDLISIITNRFTDADGLLLCISTYDTDIISETPIIEKEISPIIFYCGIECTTQGKASIGMIQRKYDIGFNAALKIIQELETLGVVGPENGTEPRRVLMSTDLFRRYFKIDYTLVNNDDFLNTITETSQSFLKPQYDYMEGHQFEYFCADILRKNGFLNVEVTQGSGDHGIDILADKDDVSYAIQCKCYSSNIGNSAVQQALSGKCYYKKDIAVVLTNRYFTAQAIEEANANSVKLWDRDRLNQMIEQSE